MKKKRVVFAVLMLGAISLGPRGANGQSCPYKDPITGEPVMQVGGEALATAIEIVDTGNRLPEYHSYENWDLNDDSIPDSFQVALFTELLCLPVGTQHPTIDIASVQAAFEQNLGTYWDSLNILKDIEDEMIALAPFALQMGTQLKDAATTAGMINAVLPPEAFNPAGVPDVWQNKSWNYLAGFMTDYGNNIQDLVDDNHIGDQLSSTIWVALNNAGSAPLIAALIGISENAVTDAMDYVFYQNVLRAVALKSVDWAYVLTLFEVHGLDENTVTDIENAIANVDFTEESIPVLGEDFSVFEAAGVELLSLNAQWGETPADTLDSLFAASGGGADIGWDEIAPAFSIEVPDITGMVLDDAINALAALGLYADARPNFDESVPENTVIAQNPIFGQYISLYGTVTVLYSIGQNTCPEFYPEASTDTIFDIGGTAVADAIALVDVENSFTAYHDYEAWDLNLDAILDKTQFTLLAKLLCIPSEYLHPSIDLPALRDTFQQNLTLAEELRQAANDNLQIVLNLAPLMVDLTAQMQQPENAAALAETIEGAAFLDGTVPLEWAGLTYGSLANFLFKAGDGTIYHESHGNIATGQAALDNTAATYLAAAAMGLTDDSVETRVLNNPWYKRLMRGLLLKGLDWDYLREKFGLDTDDVLAVQEQIDNSTVDPDVIPVFTEDFNTLLALMGESIWGPSGELLDEILDSYDGNVASIYDEIIDPYLYIPAEGEGEVPAEGEGEVPAEGEGEALAEGEGEVPAEGEGEALAEGEGEVTAEGEVPAEGEGEVPAEGEGEVPAEGEGEPPLSNVEVPDLAGLTLEDAITAIEAAGLVVGTVTEAPDDTVPENEIISQNPDAGTLVVPGTPVDLVVSTGQGCGCGGFDFTNPATWFIVGLSSLALIIASIFLANECLPF